MAKVKEKSRSKAAQHPGYMQPTSQPDDLPMFDTNLVTNSTAQLGGTAYLHCRVRNLNNRAVSNVQNEGFILWLFIWSVNDVKEGNSKTKKKQYL